MQSRLRFLMDAAAQGAQFALFWVMFTRAKVNGGARSLLAFVASQISMGLDRAIAPYFMAAAMAAGGLAVLAPFMLIAGAGISVLWSASPHPSIVGQATPPPRSVVVALPPTTHRPPAVAPPTLPVAPQMSFLERFNTLDETRWQISDGWDNGSWMSSDWRRSSLQPSPDGLAILLTPNPPGATKPFAGGELQSHQYFRYGYYEVRMRVPRGNGIVVGFFTYALPGGPASQQEIDIEFVGSRTNQIEFGYHLGRHSEGQRVRLPFDATQDYHTYAFEWTPGGIRWYVDNRLAHLFVDDAARRLTTPQRIYLSMFGSRLSAWTGDLDPASAPWRLDVSCVAQAREYRGQSLCVPQG